MIDTILPLSMEIMSIYNLPQIMERMRISPSSLSMADDEYWLGDFDYIREQAMTLF